jgi:hypothetical protein
VTIPAKVPARLFGILAREAPKGILLRRGPSKWVQFILWHTDTDTFEYGQWFKGKIYGRRSDLSPDGSLFIYFAQKIEGRTLEDTEYTYAWTAISRPPYLTALALWPKGDCWHGGGLFLDKRTVWLNHKPEISKAHPDHKPHGLKVLNNPEAHGEDEPIYEKRLERDGWLHVQQGIFNYTGKRPKYWVTEKTDIWEKAHPTEKYNLRMEWVEINFPSPGDPRVDHFWLMNRRTDQRIAIDGATWADWDHRGRLVFTREGQLFASEPEPFEPQLITDFNSQEPYELVAPAWAQRW